MSSVATHARRLERAEQKVAILERLIEEKTRELFQANAILSAANSSLAELYRMMASSLLVVGPDGTIMRTNPSTVQLLGYDEDVLTGQGVDVIWPRAHGVLRELTNSGATISRVEEEWLTAKGKPVPVMVSASLIRDSDTGSPRSLICVAVDLSDRQRREVELRHLQKLESIGQLAAGIAHEINTPMQFIGDNVEFLSAVLGDLLAVIAAYEALPQPARDDPSSPLAQALEHANLPRVRERAPRAFERTLAGVSRVSRIVRALKVFSHPENDVAQVDINQAVETTLVVCANEYRYVADVAVSLGTVPPIIGHAGDIGQVLLNLVVNAAHAIESTGKRGTITLTTAVDGGNALITVRDTGCGIPAEIRERVFEPFFTTKPVGKGTGQGLALAHAIITKRHGGSLTFTSEVGVGTTFEVRLPIARQDAAS